MTSGTVVVTGATRGIGRAMARGFAAADWVVVGCGRNAPDIEELRSEFGAPHRFDAIDVAQGDVAGWAEEVVAGHGPPDLLINNAGLINQPAPLWEVPEEEFSRVVDVNVKGVYRVCKAFLPAMIERGRGVVVNLSSGWGRSTSPEVAPYCATKFAVEGLSRALAQELPAGMAAVAMSPGVIDTDMLRSAWGARAANSPSPEEWAVRAIPFLLSIGPEHSGQSLTVPG